MAIILGAQVWQDGVLMGEVRGGRLPDMPSSLGPTIPVVADRPFIIIGMLAPFEEALENPWRNLHPIPGAWQVLQPDGGELLANGIWGAPNIQWSRPPGFTMHSGDIWRAAAQFEAVGGGRIYDLEFWFGNDPYFGTSYRLVTDLSVVVGVAGQPPPEMGALGISVNMPFALVPAGGVEPAITVQAGPQAAHDVEVHIIHPADMPFFGASVPSWDGPTELGPMTFLYLGDMAAGEERRVTATYLVPRVDQTTSYSWLFSAHASDRPQSPTVELMTVIVGPESPSCISGGVFNAQGVALPGATVTIAELGRSVVADQWGIFYFPQVPIGSYTVRATRTGYLPSQASVQVGFGECPYVPLTLQAAPPPGPGQGKPLPWYVYVGAAVAGVGLYLLVSGGGRQGEGAAMEAAALSLIPP